MKKLNAPDWRPLDDFDAIIANKSLTRRRRLRRARARVKSSYCSYRSKLRAPPRPVALSPRLKRDLQHCYSTATAGLQELKKRLERLNDTVLCPYCDISEATTYDHHLPKAAFPEFSICAYNLVPACHACQKDERATQAWCDGRGRRLLLHPYYDPIDGQGPLFTAKITTSMSLPRVDYQLNATIGSTVKWFPQLTTHWNTLNLGLRYARIARYELPGLMNLIRGCFRRAEDAQRGLKAQAEALTQAYGPNHWKVALFAAAADDAEFIRYALRGGRHEA